MDVKTDFLNENLKEKIYIKQLKGFGELRLEGNVCLLQRSLYEL